MKTLPTTVVHADAGTWRAEAGTWIVVLAAIAAAILA
jgi:hypothetical protein